MSKANPFQSVARESLNARPQPAPRVEVREAHEPLNRVREKLRGMLIEIKIGQFRTVKWAPGAREIAAYGQALRDMIQVIDEEQRK